ncbi:MAG TPA: hypothetical protein VGH70_13385 [Bradyrhizobium sp.]
MRTHDVWAGIAVNFGVPLLGVIGFAVLCRRMWQLQIPSPPIFSYFILFASFGGWLVVFLTELVWRWSGMASLGVGFLMFIAPILTAGIAFGMWKDRTSSAFHRGAVFASIAYSGLAWSAVGAWVVYLVMRPNR